jgi:hypothetical protein
VALASRSTRPAFGRSILPRSQLLNPPKPKPKRSFRKSRPLQSVTSRTMPISSSDPDHGIVDDDEYLRTPYHGGCWGKRCGTVAVIAVGIVLTLTNLGISMAATQFNKAIVIRDDGVMIAAADSTELISTVGAGIAFQFPVAMDGPVPYSCIGMQFLSLTCRLFDVAPVSPIAAAVPVVFAFLLVCLLACWVDFVSAADLWRSVKHGYRVNVILSTQTIEFGATMTFQSSIKNTTHACMHTMMENHQMICIDFASTLCDREVMGQQDLAVEDSSFHQQGPSQATSEATNSGTRHAIGNPDDYRTRARRVLFETTVKVEDAGNKAKARSVRGGHRRLCEAYGQFGSFCPGDIIPITYVGL